MSNTSKTFRAEVMLLERSSGKRSAYQHTEYLFKDNEYVWNPYIWEDGNFSCDCNRKIFFYGHHEPESTDPPCGNDEYQVVYIKNLETGEIIYQEEDEK